MLRRLSSLVALVVFGLIAVPVVVAPGASASPQSTSAPTAVIHLRPVNGSGHLLPGYTVVKRHGKANCEAGSEATGNAYRCFAGRFVYDPCWVEIGKTFVVCLQEPWSFDVVQLHVTKGYSGGGVPKKPATLPWGVQISNGQQCGLIQGAGGAVAGKRINYGCQHATYVLYGNVNKSHRVWRIRKARPTGGGHYKPAGHVLLSKAWFGKRSRRG